MKKIDWTCVIVALLFAWFIISFFDVIAHNCNPNPQYAFWNIWAILWY